MGNILVCDDERSICELLDIALRRDGHKVETVTGGELAKRKIDSALFDVIVTDIKMPNVDGVEVLRHAHQISPESAVILMTAVDDYEAAVQAVKAGGATDYIRKSPGLVDEVKLAIARALTKVSLSRQNFALRRDAATRNSLDNIVGASAALEKLKQTIRTVATTSSTILVFGESGTGKELVARAVHTCSPRAGEAFVSVNCGAFPETLLESELFGYVKGAFTGANQNRRGLFEVADQGTIFLDEIGEMTMPMQVKLLRVLQERTVRPVGATTEIPVDVRVIAATNRDLDRQVTEGTFREDLYYRLNVIPIRVPGLRERREDVPLLANHFLKKYAPGAGKSIHGVAAIVTRSSDRLRLARKRPTTGEHDRARGSARRHERTARRIAGGTSQGSRRSRGRGNRCDHGGRRGSARRREHGKLRCPDRALALAICFRTNQRRAGPCRRCAWYLLPVVPAPDEEVRVVRSGFQLSAISRQFSHDYPGPE